MLVLDAKEETQLNLTNNTKKHDISQIELSTYDLITFDKQSNGRRI